MVSPLLALTALVVLVAVATAIGLVLRSRDGRARRAAGSAVVSPESLGADPHSFGTAATFVQFSTELCSRCPAARRLLRTVAGERDGIAHVEVDVTHRPEIARRFGVLQTPTILLVDPDGSLRARFGGVPSRLELDTELDRLVETSHA